MEKLRYFLSIFIILSATLLHAQDVHVTIECPRVVKVGEPFQMAVKVNADANNPKLPEMTAFTILRSFGKSSSSSVSIINGKVSQSMEVTFNYIVQANQEGTQEIGPVEVTVDRKTYQSTPATVQVVAGNASTQPQQGSGGNVGAGAQSDNSQVQTDNREVFVELLTDRRQVYQGEYISATVKLFSTSSVATIGNVELPAFDGFFKQELETPPIRQLEQETVNGVPHLTGVLRRYVLFPQRSGTLTVSPCKMEVGINQRVQSRSRSLFDDIFGSVQTIPREVTSRPVNITVLPLPEGKPASFSGGVGQMKFDAIIDKTEVKANDPVTLKVTVSGNGNMRFIDAPRINFPPDFEVYDPKISTQLNPSTTAGSKTFEYLIIPRHGGTYKIPAIEFSYFDPQAKQYKILKSNEYTISVERSEEQPGTTVVSGITREDVKFLGKDIRYIKAGKMNLRRVGENFLGTWKFWLWYLVPLVAFAAIVYLRRKYIRKYANVAFVKERKANRYAAKRFKKARKYMDSGQKEQFYEELSRALWGYLGDKLNIPVAELSKDNAKAVMEQRNVDVALTDEFTGVIDDCEFARYAPVAAGSDMNALYSRAVDVINKMQKVV